MKIRQFVNLLAILLLIVCIAQPVVAETEDPATNYYNIAELAIGTNEYEKALEYFNKALASNTTLIGMGDALMFTYRDKAGVLT
jgi:tetratricopeptide (TPR) repeat protein